MGEEAFCESIKGFTRKVIPDGACLAGGMGTEFSILHRFSGKCVSTYSSTRLEKHPTDSTETVNWLQTNLTKRLQEGWVYR